MVLSPEPFASSMPTDNCLNLEAHQFTIHGTKFEISKRYTVLEPVGQGAYGIVCAAKDETTQEDLAIKKIEAAFEHITFTKRTLRELRILHHLKHENIIDIRTIFLPGTKDSFEDIYIVSTLMETDLASILKSSQALSDDHSQFFLYQILRGMKYVHSAEVIHRDLKPRNLLVNSNCDLKICDFGLARVDFKEHAEFKGPPMTEYICTRWYRAPEVLCSWVDYTSAIDLWSTGCIFAEMLGRKAVFPGHNTQHQLQLIITLLGSPSSADLQRIPHDKCRKFLEALPQTRGKPLETVFEKASPVALDFLFKMLHFDPTTRIDVKQALAHEYLSQLHCPEDEPVRAALDPNDFEFERRKINVNALREELFVETLAYYPELVSKYPSRFDITEFRLLEPGESQYSSDEES